MPQCEDNVQAARQLTQLGNIKHDLSQICHESEMFLESAPHSEKFQGLFNNATNVEEMRQTMQYEIEDQIKKWDDEQDLINEIETWMRKREESLDNILDQPESASSFTEAAPLLESRLAEITEIVNGCMQYSRSLDNIATNKEYPVLKNRMMSLQSKAERDQQDVQKGLLATRQIQKDVEELSERIHKLQVDFQNTVQKVNEIGNSNIRLKRFESIIDQIKVEETPIDLIADQLNSIRSSLLPTQFDHAQVMMTEQKSRMADLLARSENRHAHLRDVIKEKTEFEQKLENYQTGLINAQTDLEIPIARNVSIDQLSQQLQLMNEKQQELASINAEYKQLRDVQLNAVKLGLPDVEKDEIDSLDQQTATLLSYTFSLAEKRVTEVEELKRVRTKLWNQGRDLNTWIDQAEKKMESRLRQFPVNPDSMAKLIAQYKVRRS